MNIIEEEIAESVAKRVILSAVKLGAAYAAAHGAAAFGININVEAVSAAAYLCITAGVHNLKNKYPSLGAFL